MTKRSNSNWETHPTHGLGPLEFGMSRAEVSRHNGIFGEVTRLHYYGHSAETFKEDLGPFADVFTEDIIAAAKQAAQGFDKATAHLTEETRQEPCLMRFEYAHDKLCSIDIRNDCQLVHLQGQHIFAIPPKDLISALHNIDKGYTSDSYDLLFEGLGMMLYDFFTRDETSGVWNVVPAHAECDPSSPPGLVLFSPSQTKRYKKRGFSVNYSSRFSI